MKKHILFFSLLLFTLMTNAQETPLLDRDLFFGNPEITGGQLSPDGQWISFMKAYEGIMNIWVKKIDEPFEKARPLTDSRRPISGYFWTEDGKYILYGKDKDGDENFNIYAVNPMATADSGKLPESRNLTPMKDIRAGITMVSKKNPDILLVEINDRDKAWHDLYQLNISDGKLTKIYENKDRTTGYDFDWDEDLRILSRTDEKGNTTMFYKETDSALVPIYETSVTEQAYIAGWTPDNKEAYLVTNKGDINLKTIYTFNPKTKALTLFESDPLNKVDAGGLVFSDKTKQIILTSYTDDKTRRYWKDKYWEENYKFLVNKFPHREINLYSLTQDETKCLFSTSGDIYAPEVYYFDTETKNIIFQYTPRPKLKAVEQYLSPMQPISYKSSDGLEIPAYLTIPKGSAGKNLPAVVLVHGGPKGPRDHWGYNAEVQFLANRGYAVLQPNFRASGGYGKKFLNAGDLQWGKLMQDDITLGAKTLVEKGYADSKKIAIMGGSYGGYATLAGLAFTPDLYACGVDIVGPSNIFTLLESVPPYWEAAKAHLYKMVGDPKTADGKARITEASPLFSADKINKPLLIIQGANDPRVKKAEADQIVIALREKGKKISYLLANDEGHGFAKPVNKMAMYAETERFLAEILQGRYQKEMPENVAKRLKELQVNIASVTYAPPKNIAPADNLAVDNPLKTSTINYAGYIEVQGQKLPISIVRTIAVKDNHYTIIDTAKTPMGDMIDETVMAKDYKIAAKTINQMGTIIPIKVENNILNIELQGQKTTITMQGNFFIDGAGLDLFIAGLPLTKGYTTVFEMPDLTKMKAKKMELKVTGEEMVNNKNCIVVSLVNTENPNDNITYWIDPPEKMSIKSVQTIPELGNAKMTILKN